MKKELLFSITKKDLRIEYYKSSGKGGQNRNKRETAVRITHKDSGAVGNASEQRNRQQNLRMAFKRLVESDKFKSWMKIETARRTKEYNDIKNKINNWVEEQTQDKYLKIETF